MAVPLTLPRPLLYVEREARVWMRLWRGSVFSGLVTPILFLGAMGLGLGGLVDESSGSVDGLDYLTFVTPGLLVAGAAQNAAGSALWPVMAGVKWVRVYHAAVATPLRPRDVHSGYVAWIGLLTTLHAAPFVAVAALLGGVPSAWGVLAVPAAALCGVAFAAPLAAFAASQETEGTFPVLQRVVILPLFLFSGTFFPLSELPAAVRPVAWLTPMWHGVELSRGATTGALGLGATLLHLGVLSLYVVTGLLWGARTFTRRLTP